MTCSDPPLCPPRARRLIVAGRVAGWLLAVAGFVTMYRVERVIHPHSLWGFMLALYASLVVLAALTGTVLARWREASIDADGIAVGRRRVRWAEVTSVEVRDQGATVHGLHGDLQLDRLHHWLWWARQAQARLEAATCESESPPRAAVPAEEVSGWLGLAPGETLACEVAVGWRMRPFLIAFSHGMWFVPPYFFLADYLAPNHPFALLKWFLFALPLLYGAPYSRAGYPRRIVASEDGLALAYEEAGEGARGYHREWFPWDSLRHESEGRVTATVGSFYVPPMAHRERLLAAIRQALAARQAGLRLPAGANDIPDSALSRATGEVNEPDRGLSLADGPG